MYYYSGKRLIYLAHPRTASVATAWELQRLGFEKLVPGDHHSRIWALWDDGKALDKRAIEKKGKRHEWFAFTTVRNHWDAAVSWRFKRHKTDSSRWDSVRWRELFASNRWVTQDKLYWLHADDADRILRYETLETELVEMLQDYGFDFDTLSEQNVTEYRKGRHYREFFTDEGRKYIGERFEAEIKRFGYQF